MEFRKGLLISYNIYSPRSDFSLFNHIDKNLYNSNLNNVYDVDLHFIRNAYNELSDKSNEDLVTHIKNLNFASIFLHPKQLLNIFGKQIILKEHKNKIYVGYKMKDYYLSDFIKLVETMQYDDFKNTLLELKINNNFRSSDFLVLAFVGDKNIGIKLINRIILYKNIQDFQLAICIKSNIYNNEDDRNEIMTLLNNSNINYILYVSNELGNDITPSLLMYDDIRNNYSFDYIIKIHTKTDEGAFNALTYTLFSAKLENLIASQKYNTKSSCHGNFKSYYHIDKDILNKTLYNKFSHLAKRDHFVSGTIFFTNYTVMDNMVVFMKANYFNIFMQNLYDNNQVNKETSYPHFMERLFGFISDKSPLNAKAI